LDNLSTHTPAALYEAFPPAEARRVLRRLEFHYVPKHASWRNGRWADLQEELEELFNSQNRSGSHTTSIPATVLRVTVAL
jgi:hypothetical protein